MIEIEHIFIALASPLFVFCFVMEKEERRHLLSLLAGFGAALLAGYINSCFTMLFQMTGTVKNVSCFIFCRSICTKQKTGDNRCRRNRAWLCCFGKLQLLGYIWLGEPAFFHCPWFGYRSSAPVVHHDCRNWRLFAL